MGSVASAVVSSPWPEVAVGLGSYSESGRHDEGPQPAEQNAELVRLASRDD
jgi:hypothetical protein